MEADPLGIVAGVLTTIAFVPQVLRILRTRSAHDVSWLLFGILSLASALWLWYGVRLNSLPLMATNVVTLVLQLWIFALKWRYGRVHCDPPRRRRERSHAAAQPLHATRTEER
ncbi:MAG: SemiSWEET family sugar transporter [Burkholderiales bacterium]|nr:SemiSWEET family sugar transporter [Burkholderiales bacterium]